MRIQVLRKFQIMLTNRGSNFRQVCDKYLRTRRKPRKLLDPNLKTTNRKVVSIFKKMELKIPNIDFYLVLSLSRVHKKKKIFKKIDRMI